MISSLSKWKKVYFINEGLQKQLIAWNKDIGVIEEITDSLTELIRTLATKANSNKLFYSKSIGLSYSH